MHNVDTHMMVEGVTFLFGGPFKDEDGNIYFVDRPPLKLVEGEVVAPGLSDEEFDEFVTRTL